MSDLLGIARERLYSPGKVEDDRAILEAVAARLRRRHRVRVVSADGPLPSPPPGAVVFAMCQGPEALDVLERWEGAGTRIINSPAAIRHCHRHLQLTAWERAAVPHPAGVLVPTNGAVRLPGWLGEGAWLKRADVHATQAGDVVRVRTAAEARDALEQLRRRGVTAALVQRHVAGGVIKFYAVRERFFAWFPAANAPADLAAADVAALRALAGRGAAALGLEIYGGDCVRQPDGALCLIDLNDWPSYAPCREAAAEAIAHYLDAQTEGA